MPREKEFGGKLAGYPTIGSLEDKHSAVVVPLAMAIETLSCWWKQKYIRE